MYQYLDRPVVGLPEPDRLLLGAMRHWVAAIRAGRCPCAALGPALASRMRAELLPDLHMAMMLLDREGLGRLAFRPPCCAEVGDDEALLLATHAAARRGDLASVEDIVAQVVKPGARHALAVAIGRIAVALAD